MQHSGTATWVCLLLWVLPGWNGGAGHAATTDSQTLLQFIEEFSQEEGVDVNGDTHLDYRDVLLLAESWGGERAYNRAPLLAPVGNRAAAVGRPFQLQLFAVDPDGDPITYGVAPLLPNAQLDAPSGRFTFMPAPSQLGSATLTFSAGDGALSSTAEVVLGVIMPPTGELRLLPETSVVLSEDSQFLTVLDEISDYGHYVYSVNGTPGGDGTVGTIGPHSTHPNVAVYDAPKVTQSLTVIVGVQDTADMTRVATATVTIRPIDANLLIQPAMPIVAVNRQLTLVGGMNVTGVGFVPLKDIFWKVNGMRPGTPQLGVIDDLGVYHAPAQMPDPLPVTIQVGFAFNADGPVQATAELLLAELILEPSRITALEAGPAGVIHATAHYSDDSSIALDPAVDLLLASEHPQIATVEANGQVHVNDDLGLCYVLAQDVVTGARAGMFVESRSDVLLTCDAELASSNYAYQDRAGFFLNEIEYTRPGARFFYRAYATYKRGPNAGASISADDARAITFSADGTNVIAYDSRRGVPHLEGIVAAIDVRTGLVEIGNRPGAGTITATYDDGFVRHSFTTMVRFTRMTLTATAFGEYSLSTTDMFVTEFVRMQIVLDNPRQTLLGQELISVTLDGKEEFRMAWGANLNSGQGNFVVPYNFFRNTDELLLTSSSNMDRFHPLLPGRFSILIAPNRAGMHRFKIECRYDRGIEPVELVFNVKRTTLESTHTFFSINSPVVANGYVKIQETPGLPQRTKIFELFNLDSVWQHDRNDLPVWTHTFPDGSKERVLATSWIGPPPPRTVEPNFFGTFRELGDHKVRLAFSGHGGVESEELVVHVVPPTEVVNATRLAIIENDTVVPDDNQLGTFQILAPLSGGWVKGQPINVSVQMYNALGQPRTIGKSFYRRTIVEGELVDEFRSSVVVGLNVGLFTSTPFVIDGTPRPLDGSGLVSFSITFTADEGLRKDIVVQLMPQLYPLEDGFAGVPLETQVITDGMITSWDKKAYGVADFGDDSNNSYLTQCFLIRGRGLGVVPRQLPIPTQRLKDAVASGRVSGSADATFYVTGNSEDWTTSLASGLASSDLGPGMSLVSNRVEGDKLFATASVSAVAAAGERDVTFNFNNGRMWQGGLELVGLNLTFPSDHADKNLPLNARHHNAHPIGSQVFMVEPLNVVQRVDLELIPSILPGEVFRDAVAENPLVGFTRDEGPLPGQVLIKDITTSLFQKHNSFFLLFGDTTDLRTLDPGGTYLSEKGQPDFLPDFVSRMEDSETLLAKLGDNLADCVFFTAYNLTARVENDLPSRDLAFNPAKAKQDISETYDMYSLPPDNVTVQSVADLQANRRVSVYVDHEANPSDHDLENNRLYTGVPRAYFGGLLDQFYLWGTRTISGFEVRMLAQDGRVLPFDGDRGERPFSVTGGVKRNGFGLELDAVLYDPSVFTADEAPNSPPLLDVDVVKGGIEKRTPKLSSQHLLPQQGGSSGGYYDRNQETPGSHFIVAKTPGQEFPGLHTGYLIQDTPEDQVSVRFDTVADDISDVELLRESSPGVSPEGGPIGDTIGTFYGLQQRRVMTYGTNKDKKAPIRTAFQSTFEYLIDTDPAGVDVNEVKAALWVREKPLEPKDTINLLVETQSDGSEGQTKVFIDAGIDLTIRLTMTATLSALTAGAGGALCAADFLGSVAAVGVNVSIGLTQAELMDPDEKLPGYLRYSNSVLSDGLEVTSPFLNTGIQPTLRNLINTNLPSEELKKLPLHKQWKWAKPSEIGICNLLGAPFFRLKDLLVGSFSAEDLGGFGSAEAFGSKSLTVTIPFSARRETGTFCLQASVSRRNSIHFSEERTAELSNYPDFDVDASLVSDVELVGRVLDALDDPARADEAQDLLLRMKVNGLWRRTSIADNVYSDYRMRFASLPMLETVVVPRGDLGNGLSFGEFVLTPGVTRIPVATASSVSVSRSNANAQARAAIRVKGYEMILVSATIPSPSPGKATVSGSCAEGRHAHFDPPPAP